MEVVGNKYVVYEFGKFVLDPKERTLLADGVPVHLRAKEFDTLLLLVEHNGHLLTKEEMMTALWQNSFVEESNLARQISQLRKIFNTDHERFIETLPKHGYRFTADLRRTIVELEDQVILEKLTVKRVTFSVENEPAPAQLALPPARGANFTFPRIVLLIAVLGLVGVASVWFWNERMRPDSSQINTLAVLPLRSLNGDEDNKALGLGLTDALITKLASTRRFIVRPTNAVASFGNNADPVETGRRLNVDAVLEGTIQQADGRLRVNARLLRTATGEQIWAEGFEQPSAGIFALQDALSANIAKTLDFELSKSDSDRMLHRGTESAEAYEKYLRGRFYQSQNTPNGLNRSIELFQQAAALDPNFAEAHAGIADANLILFNFGLRPAAETIPTARQAVNRALQLNPELSNAYTS
ncbi:MAG: winged helix-turn-helix domain-containing protein, partial [Blastocatellia bacterium]